MNEVNPVDDYILSHELPLYGIQIPEEVDRFISKVKIESGMKGQVNLILPNGQYHVRIFDSKGSIIAYAPFNEEDLESTE